MSDKLTSGDSNNENENENENENGDEFIKPVSEEEGLKSAENVFKAEGNKAEDSSLDEDKEFLRYLRFCKKAKDLGLFDSKPTAFYYQGGVHFTNSNVENYGNVVGNDQTISSNVDTGGFSGETRNELADEKNIESIETVFDRCEDIRQRSFMIALAALNGCNYRVVVEASQRLQSILQPQAELDTEATTSRSLNIGSIEKKRSQWLEHVFAYLSDGYEVTEYGKSRIKTVLFTNQEAPLAILSHVWHEYDAYAEATLKWLRELGEDSTFEVRLRAAAVAGQLAIYEFRPVREKIISPWAKSDKQFVQRLAALALTVVAYDENEGISQQALNLLHHWSVLQNSPRLHWTSVAAYGGYIGLLFPQPALDSLRLITQSGDGRIFADIAQAVASLFEAGQKIPNLHLLVLSTLKSWVEQGQKTAVHRLSLLIFWGLLHESWLVKDNIRQPTLLYLAKQSQEIEDIIIYLMRNALNLEFSRELILPEILRWLKFVDQQQSLYKTHARILFTLASPGKERERICSYLNKWSRNSESAIGILKLIQQNS